jgi:DNA repair exonuclease SbcCD ATPase subunit
MIIFRYVKWKNLLSTGNYFTEIRLDQNSQTLIIGENGSGKSTLLDALCFGLFGKAFRPINKPQLLNSINGKDCLVEIGFDTNNRSYKIVRGIKPNVFEIYQDGDLINQDAAARDYQEFLEKTILKLNYKSFTQIVILGSASFVPFMQLSAADRRAIIEDLLDIQIFSTMNSLVKERVSSNKEQTQMKKSDFALTQQKHDMLKSHIDEMKQNNEDKIKGNDKEIENNLQNISSLQKQTESLTQKVEELQCVVNSRLEVDARIKKITKLESQIESTLSKVRKDIDFLESHDNCPTCRQAIAEEFKHNECHSLTVREKECETGLQELEKKLNEEQTKLIFINDTQKEIQNCQVQIATNNVSISEITKNNTKLLNENDELKNSVSITEKEENELGDVKRQIKSLAGELKELIEEKSYYEVAYTLLKDSGIKTRIVKQYLPIINKLVNKYLASLDFFVNFSLDENFKETIKSRYRDEFSYHNFSEGEKQRIDMALMLTWRAVAKLKNSSNTNLLILDETFDSSLDANGTEELMKILHMLDGVNLFVISHKGDVLQDKFMNVVKFKKDKNFSKMC